MWSYAKHLLELGCSYYALEEGVRLSDSSDPNILRISGVVLGTIIGILNVTGILESNSRALRIIARNITTYYGSNSGVADL
jgi:hypothetical protein